MNSTKQKHNQRVQPYVWEICKFWILQNSDTELLTLLIVWEICKFLILQNFLNSFFYRCWVWEICKFWILQNNNLIVDRLDVFERYVNFEFYKTGIILFKDATAFERYVNFEFYKTELFNSVTIPRFERYVNFEFYKTTFRTMMFSFRLRDM